MERLTFGYGVPKRQVHAPHVPRPAPPPPEDQVRPTLADPLPGESSDWAYFGLLAFTALLFLRPQDQLPFLEPLHLAELAAIVGLVAMAVKRLVRGLPIVHLTPEVIGLLAFGFVLVATTPFSFWPGGSIEVITGLYLKVLLIVLLMVNSLNTPLRLRRFSWLIVVASAYISLRAVIDYLRGVNLVENGRVAGAIQGIFGNPNDLALNMVTFLPIAGLLALGGIKRARAARRESLAPGRTDSAAPRVTPIASRRPPVSGPSLDSATTRLVAALSALLMVMAIVFTKSRGGALGLAAALGAFVYYGRRLRPGFAVGTIVLVVILLPLLPSSFWARMGSITDPSEDVTGSREARKEVMTDAFNVFLERPLTGIGPGQFKNYNPPGKKERWREAHDVWLQVASETGIAGVLVFGYLVFAAFHTVTWSKRRLKEFESRGSAHTPRAGPGATVRPRLAVVNDVAGSTDLGILRFEATALLPSLVGWFVCAIFASVAYNWTFYYLLGLCIATRELTRAAIAARTAKPDVPAHGTAAAEAR